MKKRPLAEPRSVPSHDYPAGDDAEGLMGALAQDLEDHLGGMQRSARSLNERAAALGDERLGRTAANILQAAAQMSAFVADLLPQNAGAFPRSLKPEPVNLGAAAAAAVHRYGETARNKKIALRFSDRQPAVIVAANRAAVDQVLANLISNALKFSPAGKRVWVSVGPATGGRGQCQVRDEGPGFTARDRLRLFQRYRRLSAQPTAGEASTGLGLSIAKKLVAGMRGTLRCASVAGRGATFTLALPAARPDSPP